MIEPVRIHHETEHVPISNEKWNAMQAEHRRQGIFGDPVWSEPIPFTMPLTSYREPLRQRISRWLGDKLIGAGCWFRGIDREDLYL